MAAPVGRQMTLLDRVHQVAVPGAKSAVSGCILLCLSCHSSSPIAWLILAHILFQLRDKRFDSQTRKTFPTLLLSNKDYLLFNWYSGSRYSDVYKITNIKYRLARWDIYEDMKTNSQYATSLWYNTVDNRTL